MKKICRTLSGILFAAALLAGLPKTALRAGESDIAMSRLFHPVTLEHLYTSDVNEVNVLTGAGWDYEGTSWQAPSEGIPVYRVFHPGTGEHFYTADAVEYRYLVEQAGWNDEGPCWYSDPAERIPVYRLFNEAAGIGAHHYTTDPYERDVLIAQYGWTYEGIAWYGADVGDAGASAPAENGQPSSDTNGFTGYDPADGYAYSVNSNIFHYAGCPEVARIKERNLRIEFVSRDELIDRGKTPCKVCQP